jgi:hypothetical protein
VEAEGLGLGQQRLELAAGGAVGLVHQFREEGGDGEALGVLGGEGGAGEDLLEVLGQVGLAGEVVGEDGAEHLALVDGAVDGLAEGEGPGEALEEGAVAADDVELGVVEGLGEHAGLGLGDVAAGLEPLDGDGLVLLEGEAVLLVLLAGALERLHGLGLGGDAGGLGQHALAEGVGLGGPLLLDGGGLGLADPGAGEPLLLLAEGGGEHLLLGDAGLGEAGGGLLGLLAFREADLGAGVFVRGLQLGLGGDEALAGLEPRDLLAGLGGLALDHEVLLGLPFGGDAEGLLVAVGLGQGADVLGVLFLLGDGLLDGDATADHLGDLLALLLEFLLLGDALELDLALAGDRLEGPGLLGALALDGGVPLLGLLDDGDGAFAVLGGDLALFLVLLPQEAGALLLLLGDADGLVLLPGLDDGDLAGLAGLGLGAAAVEVEDGLVGDQVLAAALHALLLAQLVGLEVVLDRQLGDLPDAVGIHDVVLVELREGGLLEVVDGGVVEHVAVEVLTDDLHDVVLELVALRVEFAEVEALADGLEGLGELGDEELLQGASIGGAAAADGLGHLEHLLVLLVHADEEVDADVCPDVVLADQAILAAPGDLDGLHRDIHDLRSVDDRVHHGAGEGHVGFGLHRVDDEGLALVHLLVKPRDDHQDSDDDQRENTHADRYDDDLISHQPCSLRAACASAFLSTSSGDSPEGTFPSAATRSRGLAPSARSMRSAT